MTAVTKLHYLLHNNDDQFHNYDCGIIDLGNLCSHFRKSIL